MRRIRATIIGGLTTAAVLVATPAAAYELVGEYEMNEPSGATQMLDKSPNQLHGDIGEDVLVDFQGNKFYRFQGPLNVHNHERLILLPDGAPDSQLLDPGRGGYSVTIRFRTTFSRPNIIQKGQSEDSGGMWKLVVHTGWPRCHYRDENYNTKAIGFKKSPDPNAKVDDGDWHVLRCVRNPNSVCVYLDEGTPTAMSRCIQGSIGRINNKWPLSIGGKYRCDPAKATTTCDYFNGDIDWVRIESERIP